MGKLESTPLHHPVSHLPTNHPNRLPWHGHITVLTVSPTHRRLGYARLLTSALEDSCAAANAHFVDLYVRKSNKVAIRMYEGLGYQVFRTVVRYYADSLVVGKETKKEKEKKKKKKNGGGEGRGEEEEEEEKEGEGEEKGKGKEDDDDEDDDDEDEHDDDDDDDDDGDDDMMGGARGGEDAYDMRKPLTKEAEKKYTRNNGRNVRVGPDDVF